MKLSTDINYIVVMVLLSSTIFLLIFYLLDLFISDGGVLKSATIIVDASISHYSSITFCLRYFGALLSAPTC